MIHPKLKDKIKKIVHNEEDVDKIMDFVYWEVTKLQGETLKYTDNRLKKFIKYLKNN